MAEQRKWAICIRGRSEMRLLATSSGEAIATWLQTLGLATIDQAARKFECAPSDIVAIVRPNKRPA